MPGDPIHITRGADGRWVITSRDTKALDQLEELMARLAPPRKDYDVVYMQYATASSMKLMLDDFFSVEKKESNADKRFNRWWWDDSDSNKKDDTPRLSQRKPLKFIDDDATNSILVQGATPEVLKRIKDIVKLYDRPEKPNTRMSRITKPFLIKHSKPTVIAETIKEVYKDFFERQRQSSGKLQPVQEPERRPRTWLYVRLRFRRPRRWKDEPRALQGRPLARRRRRIEHAFGLVPRLADGEHGTARDVS